MKQVWQAEDGSTFKTERECERYELLVEAKVGLSKQLQGITNFKSDEELSATVNIIIELCDKPFHLQTLIRLLETKDATQEVKQSSNYTKQTTW